MDDEPTNDAVSLDKPGKAPAARPSRPGLGRGKPNLGADGSPMPPPPTSVRNAVVALGVSAVASLVAAISLFGNKAWLLSSYKDNNPDPGKKGHRSLSALKHAADTAPSTGLLASAVLVLALGIAARGAWRGRYWARWTVIGLWVLSTFTGTYASFIYVIGVASSQPVSLKIPSFVSAVSLIVAVVFVCLKPSVAYFLLSKPPRPDGATGRRGGLFGPRPARQAPVAAPTRSRGAAAGTRETAERSRAKQRASTESVAKGAELARARAKASKSRRTGV